MEHKGLIISHRAPRDHSGRSKIHTFSERIVHFVIPEENKFIQCLSDPKLIFNIDREFENQIYLID